MPKRCDNAAQPETAPGMVTVSHPARGIAEWRSGLRRLSDRIPLDIVDVTRVGDDLRIVPHNLRPEIAAALASPILRTAVDGLADGKESASGGYGVGGGGCGCN